MKVLYEGSGDGYMSAQRHGSMLWIYAALEYNPFHSWMRRQQYRGSVQKVFRALMLGLPHIAVLLHINSLRSEIFVSLQRWLCCVVSRQLQITWLRPICRQYRRAYNVHGRILRNVFR